MYMHTCALDPWEFTPANCDRQQANTAGRIARREANRTQRPIADHTPRSPRASFADQRGQACMAICIESRSAVTPPSRRHADRPRGWQDKKTLQESRRNERSGPRRRENRESRNLDAERWAVDDEQGGKTKDDEDKGDQHKNGRARKP